MSILSTTHILTLSANPRITLVVFFPRLVQDHVQGQITTELWYLTSVF